ncbi:hypothetical protein Ctob_014392 [Chrysochromulina tobinii]|uniref:Uncharacterized protein n=1 Tax=Chrysochromulina tobinii TaxID=1460289 RepID=A0A0M0JXB7_9EUKA|nr:hypothetical protein Ctob_014392 [Chrysochromulina tobinii]|eukprot:KOO30783.1 hypothetical protein Ctob_014392 [Chrysochromulina sp. CCMP291]
MIDEEAVQMYEIAQSGDSGGSALQGSVEGESAETSSSHTDLPDVGAGLTVSKCLTTGGKRKVGMGSGIGTLKHVNLERLKPPALLQAAKRRAEALSDAVKELNRKTEQYRKWKADAVSQKRLNDLLEGALQEAREMFDDVEAAANELRERLQLFDEAAAILHAAGQDDVPMLYAANVVRGDIAPTCIFSRFMGDAMHCFEQYVPETRRFSLNVKDWLAFAEAQSSPARCMKILCVCVAKRAYESRKTRYDKRNERNRQRTMLGKELAGAQKKAAKKKAQKKAASPEGPMLTISSIAAVEDALRDKSLPASDTVDRKHAQRLSGRLIRRTFGDEDEDEEKADEEPVTGVAQLCADDDGDGFWYSIHYPGIEDADVVDLDCLVTGDLGSSGDGTLDLVPFAEMTMPQMAEAKDLTKDALYEELAARRDLGIYKGKLAKATSKPALAAALFSHLSNLREQLEQLYAIAEGVALGEIDEGIAKTAVDQLQQTAGRQADKQAEAPVATVIATEPLIADTASKVLAFNIADLSHRFSINIARFAVSSTMDSDTLNELVEYVLSEIKRGSDGMLNVLFEKADGALTNLIRELKASVRSSCWVHKYKNNVQGIRSMADDDEGSESFSKGRLLRVVKKLIGVASNEKDEKKYRAVLMGLMGKTDMLSQAALAWVMLCPEFLDALDAEPDCWREHTVLTILGLAFLAWDMPHLTDVERSHRIELCEALLIYSMAGEQMYLPFLNESNQGAEPGLVGILASKIGPFTSQNLIAFLQNGAARRQFRQQFPDEYKSLVELSLNNNDLENFFSLIAQQLGYKPMLRDFEARCQQLDFLQRTQLDPFRDFMILLSKRKKYDLCELLLPQSVLEWNDGIAIDPQHPLWIEYLEEIARRAVAANKGKFEGIHQQHKKAATGAR